MHVNSIMLLAAVLSTARAFAPRTTYVVARSTARSMSTAMPYDEDKMPFYALGTNLAIQVGGNLGTLLEDDELDIVLEAFCDHLRGTATVDQRTVLTTCTYTFLSNHRFSNY